MTGLRIQYELLKAASVTESFAIVASQVFGGKGSSSTSTGPTGPVNEITSIDSLGDLNRWK